MKTFLKMIKCPKLPKQLSEKRSLDQLKFFANSEMDAKIRTIESDKLEN